MRVTIRGHDLPGTRFMSDGELLEHVHVAVQVGRDPVGLVPGDAPLAEWSVEVRPVVDDDGGIDVRGPAIHGKRGERFLYLTWGDVDVDRSFRMFRRAKLMVADIPPALLAHAAGATGDEAVLVAELGLSDEKGCPRCARVRPPAIRWSLASVTG